MKDQLLTGGLSGLRRTGALLIAVIGLGACDPTTTAVVAGASLATLIHTDKTLLDHAASYATDEDCSTCTRPTMKLIASRLPATPRTPSWR